MAPKLATAESVERTKLLDFIRPRHHCTLITHKRNGDLQVSPVTSGVDSEGRIVIASYPERAKVANIRRDSAVTVCIHSDEWNDQYVQIDGTAEILDLPDAVEPLVEYFRSIAGEHSDWDEYREAMVKQGKSLIRITIESWGPVAEGGFPPGRV
ncbi:PPOX class F420-dependent oxidoreductase [Rhodococcus sp. P1Y]|uniref:PPOX class F420-dependent oxidoreductase n=1 Tax=Rhodococcus sp. P1Y TaxID=1302308 RepID=UPI000EB1A685|nr:PPOX class F420-dependent oxidoreductase [Rhodococcus sp. P1Y]AYJ51086.1 PPOX class F420-dependent oxidoreductase [Rhodococcus sp. P1Y]